MKFYQTYLTMTVMAAVVMIASAAWAQVSADKEVPTKEKVDSPATDIAPPMDLNIGVPGSGVDGPVAEGELPAPNGPSSPSAGALKLSPEGQRLMVESGEEVIQFGGDMAERGISFGLGFLHGPRDPAEIRAFAHEMRWRGQNFAHQIQPKVERIIEEADVAEGEGGLPALGSPDGLPPELGQQIDQLRQRIRERIESRRGNGRGFRGRREF